jgi:hypothetical protein
MIAAALNNVQYSFEAEPIKVNAQIAISAAGVPTITYGSRAIASVVKNSDGNYTLTFNHKYTRLLGFSATMVKVAGVDITFQVSSFTPSTKTLVFLCLTAGVETAIASCDLNIEITASNTAAVMG